MSFLDSLFSGVKVFVRELVALAADGVKAVLQEVDRSAIGRATTRLLDGVIERHFGSATILAQEERELAEKFQRDGRRSAADQERLRAIQEERDQLRTELEAARQRRAAGELRENQSKVVSAQITDDEASSAVGILSSKPCSTCGASMRIRQGGFNDRTGRRSFYWLCTAGVGSCPTERLDPEKSSGSVLRKPDPNLDMGLQKRRELWTRKDILVETAQRVRQGLGEEDAEIVCPVHVLPMRLLPRASSDGRLLATYEYACLGVDDEGRACPHKIPLETFAQVSAALTRREGQGIIRH